MADFNLSKGRSGQSSDSIKIEWRALDFAGESGGYVPPSGVCDFEYPANESYVSASTPLGAVALLSGDPVNVRISASTPLGVSAVRLGEPNKAYSAAGSPPVAER